MQTVRRDSPGGIAPSLPPADWHGEGSLGAVAAGRDYRAVQAGLDILKAGGNATDAAVATLLALSVTDFGWFCIGAEVPMIVYDAKKGEVKVLCGQGVAPKDPAAIDWYLRNGIPADRPNIKAATVPGPISLFFTALSLYGTLSFEQVAQPVLSILETGTMDWYRPLAGMLRMLIETERSSSGSRDRKLQTARDRFYKGDIADVMVRWFGENGGFFTKSDFETYETRVEDPVTCTYRGYTVCKCDTWTQGPVLLQTLALLKGFDLTAMGHLSAPYIHHCVEAMKLAYADRDKYYGDPLFTRVPIEALLSEPYNDLRRELIDPLHSSTEIRPGDPFGLKAVSDPDAPVPWPGGTTTCCVADRFGNAVAATPSGNGPYTYCPELGVHFATRLTSLNTTPSHPNCIAPGKRPRITLTPTIVLKEGKPVLAISVAGGDLQDQAALAILLNHVEFGMLPAQAVTQGRFQTSHTENSFSPDPDRKKRLFSPGLMQVNDGLETAVLDALRNMGHEVTTTPDCIAHPDMLYIDHATGMMYAAGDPAASRKAGALR